MANTDREFTSLSRAAMQVAREIQEPATDRDIAVERERSSSTSAARILERSAESIARFSGNSPGSAPTRANALRQLHRKFGNRYVQNLLQESAIAVAAHQPDAVNPGHEV